jgi:SWI/SNF-related matrix-associated actin-dependent regulator 1 of chromatin subfamily A
MSIFKSIETVLLAPNGEEFMIQFPFSEERKNAVKYAVPGVRFDRDKKKWFCPVGEDQAAALQALKFRITQEAWDQIPLHANKAERLITASRAEDAELDLPGFGKQPFPFQRAGIAYALDRKRLIIGDEMGLGKTIQGLGTIYSANAFPCLIIVPASLKYNWEDEVQKCMPGKVVHVADKDTGSLLLQMADVIVTNYEQLVGYEKSVVMNAQGETKTIRTSFTDPTKKHVILSPLGEKLAKYCKFKAVILDEAHYIKSAKAARTMATQKVCDAIASMEFRLLLTGTPMLNQPSEFMSLLKFMHRLEEFGGFWHFMTYYCGLEKGKFGMEAKQANNTKELNDKLRASCYVRRKKMDVMKELPPKTRASYAVDISNRAEYDRAKKELIEWVKERVLRDRDFMQSISHLDDYTKQMRISERQSDKAEKAERNERIVRFTALKRVAAEGKVKAAKEWIANFLESGEKLVVFATGKHIIEQLSSWYPKAARIVSSMPPEERQHNVKRFQNDPTCKLMIGAMGTSAANSPAGVGHTLTAASNVLFLELGWNPALHDQCEDRCHRTTQKDNVTCHYLLAKKTIESYLAKVIEGKRSVAAQVVDGDEGETENGILDEVIEMMLGEEDEGTDNW